jgi:hypothetical protein
VSSRESPQNFQSARSNEITLGDYLDGDGVYGDGLVGGPPLRGCEQLLNSNACLCINPKRWMKHLLALLVSISTASARIGETMEEAGARLGPSDSHHVSPLGITHKSWSGRKTAGGGYTSGTTITFRKDRAFEQSIYHIEPSEIPRYLEAVARGPWQKILVPETSEEFYFNGSEVAWYNEAKALIVVTLPPAKPDGTERTPQELIAAQKRQWIKQRE